MSSFLLGMTAAEASWPLAAILKEDMSLEKPFVFIGIAVVEVASVLTLYATLADNEADPASKLVSAEASSAMEETSGYSGP